MTSTIVIDRLRIHARHGVMPQETAVGAWFRVSLEATVECNPEAYLEDELSGTVNYAEIISCIQHEMKRPSRLLENLVHRTGCSLLSRFPQIRHLALAIFKENPPIEVQCNEIGIKMNFSR